MKRKSSAQTTKRALHRYWPVLLILVLLLIGGSISGVLFAKYITTNRQQVAMISAGFHMSSDLLETSAASNKGDTSKIVIELYNFEKENNAQISAVDITYTISVTNGTLSTVSNGNSSAPYTQSNGTRYYMLSGGPDKVTHTITIIPDYTGPVTVTVASTAPFVKTLSGSFSFENPTYKIENMGGDLYKLTLCTNGYNGDIDIVMGSGVFADRTADREANWTSSSQTISVQDHETYELRFFGPITEIHGMTALTGADKTISLGN